MENELLEILSGNAKISTEQLAVMLGTDVAVVEQTIKRLEDKGIIVKYGTVINWEKAGQEWVDALIEVKVTPQRDQGFDAIAERIYRFPEVRSVYLMSGDYDLAVMVGGRTLKEVAFFVAEKLSTLDSVQSTATHFVLKKYKTEGVILDDTAEDHRLVVTP